MPETHKKISTVRGGRLSGVPVSLHVTSLLALLWLFLTILAAMVEAVALRRAVSDSQRDIPIAHRVALATFQALPVYAGVAGAALALGIAGLVRHRHYLRPTLVGAVCSVLAFLLWQSAALLLALAWSSSGFLSSAMYSALAFVPLAAAGRTFLAGRRWMLRSADDVMRDGSVRPIVFLRPFSFDLMRAPGLSVVDRTSLWSWFVPSYWIEHRQPSFEEMICSGLSVVAPVVAIGCPGDTLPRLGAARKYVAHDRWRDEVQAIVHSCRFVALVASNTAGVLWEFTFLATALRPEQIVLLVPERTRADFSWPLFVSHARALGMSIALPESLPVNTLAILFTNRGQWMALAGTVNWKGFAVVARQAANHAEGE